MGSDHHLVDSPVRSSTAPTFNNRIFKDVAGDVTVVVDAESFLLHKFPLVSRSGKLRRMVAEKKDSAVPTLDLVNFPGSPEAFELAAKFCYGINFEITAANVAHLRCAAEYLEMTEQYHENNLVSRTEAYLNEVVIHSIEKSVEVLSTCESLGPTPDHISLMTEACVEAIVSNARKEQLASSFSNMDGTNDSSEVEKHGLIDWWVEDLSGLSIENYRKVIATMLRSGVRVSSVIASLMHYAQVWLKGIGKLQIWNPAKPRMNCTNHEHDQKMILETLVELLPSEKTSLVPLSFLFGLLRMAVTVDASFPIKLELERRVGSQLEMVALDDLLIPSTQKGGSLFDVDSVCRILVNFLHRVEDEQADESGYESSGLDGSSHGSLLKVGRLVDEYLAEVAPDPYLSLQKFVSVIETLPDYARVIDDGLYRAIDIYLKSHPALTEEERRKLCKHIDCQKLSQEACNHAAQNDRIPIQMAVRVLYSEQLRLRNAMCSASSAAGDGLFSVTTSLPPSAAMSPKDTYASLRRENRELKLEVSRLRMRLTDLEKEQTCMKQEMMGKSGNGRTLLTSISRGIGRIGLFGGAHAGGAGKMRQKQSGRKGKGRSRRHSVS